jgi:hypothetical protein
MARGYSLDDFVGEDIWVKAQINGDWVCWIRLCQKYPNGMYDCKIISEGELNSASKYWLDLFDIIKEHHSLAPEDIELITPVETMTSDEIWANSQEAYRNYLVTLDILRKMCGKDLWVKVYTAGGCDKYMKVINITDTKVTCHEVLAEVLDSPADITDIGEVLWDIEHMNDNYTYDLEDIAIFDNQTEYFSTAEIIDIITDLYGQDIWEAQ